MLDNLIQTVLLKTNIESNLYFVNLANSQFTKEDFLATQIQFYQAVKFFNRPMSILVSRTVDASMRLKILRNVWEEHGEGDLSQSHEQTFLDFLYNLGNVGLTRIQKTQVCPEVKLFNSNLYSVCLAEEYNTGIALLGIIELMFTTVSTLIANTVIKRGWLTKDKLIHYKAHEKLDIRHAEDFFSILRDDYNNNIVTRKPITEGLNLGAMLFDKLYHDLYINRVLIQSTGINP